MYGVFLHNNNILKFKATFDVYFVVHLAYLNREIHINLNVFLKD